MYNAGFQLHLTPGRPNLMYLKPLLEWCLMKNKVVYIYYIVRASMSLELQRRSIISQRVDQLFETHLLW